MNLLATATRRWHHYLTSRPQGGEEGKMLVILARILFFILLFIGLQRLVAWLLRNREKPAGGGNKTFTADRPGGAVNRGNMPRDPVCGAYVDAQLALPLQQGQKSYYFCSEECRQKFIKNQAAS
jgi:YHS domain-containing protein